MCKRVGHYSTESDEDDIVKTSNKKGFNFLVLNGDSYDSSPEEEPNKRHDIVPSYTDLKAVEEETSDPDTDNDETSSAEPSEDNNDEETDEDTDDSYKGSAFLQKYILCSQLDKPWIPSIWLLLDSQSTMEVFTNAKLLTNIRDLKTR